MQKNSVNKAIIVGRLGQKPELRYTPSQVAVTNLSVATNDSRKTDSGYEDTTEWHRVVVFGKTAEFCANYLDKGSVVAVEGKLETRSWEDKDQVKRYSTEIIAREVTPISSANSSSQGGGSSPGPSQGGSPFGGEDDEPLPF